MTDELRRLDNWVADHADQDPTFSLVFREGEWSAALSWGREADDSPMVGASALGAGDTAIAAVTGVLREIGA